MLWSERQKLGTDATFLALTGDLVVLIGFSMYLHVVGMKA